MSPLVVLFRVVSLVVSLTTAKNGLPSNEPRYQARGSRVGGGLLSLFDYKEHGVVDAIVPTKIQRRLPVRPITAVRQPPAGLGSPDCTSSGAPSPRRMARAC